MANKKNNKLIESTKNGLKLNDKNILYKMPETNNVDIKDNSQELKLNFEEKVDLKKYLSEIIDATIEERIEDAIEKKVTGVINEKFQKELNDRYNNIHEEVSASSENNINIKDALKKEIVNNHTHVDKSNFIEFYYTKNINLEDFQIQSNLKNIMDKLRITQEILANMSNIPRGTIATILRKPNSISLINAYKISTALQIPIEQIFPFIK